MTTKEKELTKKLEDHKKSIEDLAKEFFLIEKNTVTILLKNLDPYTRELTARDIKELKNDL
jgi:ABC-type Fe3+-citrate transport system substrate-binding protein